MLKLETEGEKEESEEVVEEESEEVVEEGCDKTIEEETIEEETIEEGEEIEEAIGDLIPDHDKEAIDYLANIGFDKSELAGMGKELLHKMFKFSKGEDIKNQKSANVMKIDEPETIDMDDEDEDGEIDKKEFFHGTIDKN